MRLWNGRWVKFLDIENHYPKAFHARDGRVVGIFCLGDQSKVPKGPYIAIVDEEGLNLMLDIEGCPQQAKVNLSAAKGLIGVTDRRDIPPERIKHKPADWQPRQD